MDGVGIVCEYNPFHSGHMYQLDLIKKKFPDKAVVCVMSGNFVQRGDFASADKYTRAKTAVLCGADCVLEIIPPYSFLTAEGYAYSGMSILTRLGNISDIVFGSECGDMGKLKEAASILSGEDFSVRLAEMIKASPSEAYAVTREKCFRSFLADTDIKDLLRTPNNILAVEYIKALGKLKNTKAELFTHGRHGAFSASSVREKITDDVPEALSAALNDGSLPETSYEALLSAYREGIFPVSAEKLSAYIISEIRKRELSGSGFDDIYAANGIGERLISSAKSAVTLKQLTDGAKSKNHPDSRIRRAVLSSFFDIKTSDAEKEVPYTCLLAVTERGREFLGSIRKKSGIKIFTKPAKALISPDEEVVRCAEKALFMDSVYALAFPKPRDSGYFVRSGPYVAARDHETARK